MRRARAFLLGVGLWLGYLLVPVSLVAAPAGLVADRVQVLGNSQILAEGNVVVIYEGTRLTAGRVLYDATTDTLTIDGPITLSQEDGTMLLAEAASLSTDLRNGILESARIVLDRQLQLAAAEINRVQGRYTQLSKVVASSCQVCANRPVPLWQIRASQVIHDQVERQLYFYHAQLRVADIPVFYLPRLRLPDPTLKRATGFLTPTLTSNSALGTGLRMPYFIRVGDHADLTFSPFVSSRSQTLESRYRQKFTTGEIEFNSAISRDAVMPDTTRYYLFGAGHFDLPRDFKLDFNIEQVSDPSYLLDHGFSSKDRIDSGIALTRARRNEFVFADLRRFETLRETEIPIADQLPFAQIEAFYERRFFPDLLGGEGRLQFGAQGHFRTSTLDELGRDMTRIGAALEWRRDHLFTNGLIGAVEGALAADSYWIAQDSSYAPQTTHLTPSVGVTLRWPFSRRTASGAVDVIEPVAQLVWTDQLGADVPNEDSLVVEFDEANLFDLSRFPGFDRYERGARANLGLTWTHYSPSGWSFTLVGGKVLRNINLAQFTPSSGLGGLSSDWLIGGQIRFDDRLFVQSRALISDNMELTSAETRMWYQHSRLSLAAGHIWAVADPAEMRPDPTQEVSLDATYVLDDQWTLHGDWRFDIEADKATRASMNLEYRNECVSVDLSLSRRFTSSITVAPTTDIGLSVTLTGFGGAKGGTSRRCGS